MCLHSHEYFHPKTAAQSCLNRTDRFVHGDTIADDPRLRVDRPRLPLCDFTWPNMPGCLARKGNSAECHLDVGANRACRSFAVRLRVGRYVRGSMCPRKNSIAANTERRTCPLPFSCRNDALNHEESHLDCVRRLPGRVCFCRVRRAARHGVCGGHARSGGEGLSVTR
jgi:hypothetical protein